ncbi:glycoside hydrolase family 5 protein [Roridomyces roridus]|uniref:Glycoside hydrolase family 5 protein n=1 Tax=Roridomyces roridus TaxID=1738132 RepID=A0AAD7BF51_9AGAR|nr:glycoside hydrolase family 5 protein [Roridomyces roridus]
MQIRLALSFLLSYVLLSTASLPPKIYGVNLGGWLVLESWMCPQEWLDMGGEICTDCRDCMSGEFDLAQNYPDEVDDLFDNHWRTWFTQSDVDDFVDLGINTVRVPLGYWIVEDLVDPNTEYFPKGGMAHLKRGLEMLDDAGIAVILDHHALPGVQASMQLFTGKCTDDVQFYTPENYHRALAWTAVITALTYFDTSFSPVVAIEAVNEPLMDASKTPGGIENAVGPTLNATMSKACTDAQNWPIRAAMQEAAGILEDMQVEIGGQGPYRAPGDGLIVNFMDVNWQYNNPSNPIDAVQGRAGFDNHLYYSFGGVAAATPDAYLTSICNLNRLQADAALGDTPLWFGEWGLATEFNATDEFLRQWADAQKMAYSKGAGWLFWNFKIEDSDAAANKTGQWSYINGVKLGYLTRDPAEYWDEHVCDAYVVD